VLNLRRSVLSVLMVSLLVLATGVGAAIAHSSGPGAATSAATAVGPRSAVLPGVVNPKDKPTTYVFEYGTTLAYGKTTPSTSAGKGKTDVPVSYTLTGLVPSTTYHFRIAATNSDGITRGSDVAFTTAADPTASEGPSSGTTGSTQTTPGSTVTPSAPVLGQTVSVTVVRGTVLARLPGAASPVAVEGATSIGVGAILDTRRGVVELTTALPDRRKQRVTVHGGLFQVRQPTSGRGMTELVLRGPKPSCGGAHAAATSGRRPPRQLWASDHHGRFRTRGSNAVATVRGTSWYMADRCDGTYTRVKRGSVSVRDVRSGRTVVLRAGDSHLAPAAR
jgi:hypothetical protein